jgi:hypothetical protein
VTIGRVGRFNGMTANVHWLTQAWSPDGKQLASVERVKASGEPVVRIRSQAEGVRQVQLPAGLPVTQAV